jgi:hypothetical protein
MRITAFIIKSTIQPMNNFFRTLIAGYGATKLGGGCFSMIIIFILIYVALGQCNRTPVRADESSKKPAMVTYQKNQFIVPEQAGRKNIGYQRVR